MKLTIVYDNEVAQAGLQACLQGELGVVQKRLAELESA